jgi:hypothetical protein
MEDTGYFLEEEITDRDELEPRYLRVENMTVNYVTLIHPSLEDRRHRTLGPRRMALLDKGFRDYAPNQKLVDDGFIEWEFADSITDDGRNRALGVEHAMEEAGLEYLVQQILLFPEDNLDMRDSRAIRQSGPPDIPAMANVVYELIVARPLREHDKNVDVDYLMTKHLPMLENALMREKIWRNRLAIVGLLERRIRELRSMDTMGNIRL